MANFDKHRAVYFKKSAIKVDNYANYQLQYSQLSSLIERQRNLF